MLLARPCARRERATCVRTLVRVICVLAGGIGAARFARGLRAVHDPRDIALVVNTADDVVVHGLYVSPDVDTVTYTLADAIDPVRGWGLRDETWRAMESLRRFAQMTPNESVTVNEWFNLGDADLATHMYRTARRAEGATATVVAAEIARAFGVAERIVPMTDDPVATRVRLAADCAAGTKGTWIGFQEYFVRHRHDIAVDAIDVVGADTARTNAPALIADAEIVVIAPSNPLVSIGPIRALRGVDAALSARREDVVAVSPIVGGKALKGPADRMMRELGMEPSVGGVARLYAPVCATLVIDERDADCVDDVRAAGMDCVVTDTVMTDPDAAARLARTTLAATQQDGA